MAKKTTEAEFNRFKKEFNRWIEIFGLKGYSVHFFHKTLSDSYAEVEVNETGKVVKATYGLEMNEFDRKCSKGPESDARHEALHLLLHRIVFLGQERWTASDEIHDEAEKIVTILEKTL